MREIKFKAQLKDYTDWVRGYYEKIGAHHWINASDVPYLININTLCQLITKIGDVEIYEYDCYYSNDIMRFLYYNQNGMLYIRTFIIENNHFEEIVNAYLSKPSHIDDMIDTCKFIGNWHDGEEYILNEIKKLMEENANKI